MIVFVKRKAVAEFQLAKGNVVELTWDDSGNVLMSKPVSAAMKLLLV